MVGFGKESREENMGDLEKENVKLRKSLESLNEVRGAAFHLDFRLSFIPLAFTSRFHFDRRLHSTCEFSAAKVCGFLAQILKEKFEIVKLNEEGKQAIEDLKAKDAMVKVLEASSDPKPAEHISLFCSIALVAPLEKSLQTNIYRPCLCGYLLGNLASDTDGMSVATGQARL